MATYRARGVVQSHIAVAFSVPLKDVHFVDDDRLLLMSQ